ncbi:hypothetical protein Tco_0663461 [Tanacetum coccineum]
MINNGRRRGKEVNMTVGDSNDALVCFVENAVKDHIMDYSASFHATYCKEELERFKLRSGKASEISSGRSLKHQRLGDMSRIGMNMLASKGNVLDVRKVDINFCKPGGLGKQKKLSFIMSEKTRKLQSRSYGRFNANLQVKCLKFDNETPLQFAVAERLSRTFRAKSTGIRLRILEEEWRGTDTSLAHLKAAAQMKYDIAFRIRRVTKLYEAEISHLWTQFMEPEKDSIVVEHGLSSKITQSSGGSSNTSEGSKNSRSFEDNGRSDEEYSEHGAFSKEGGFETP